jgi:hypothetical protein
MHLFRKTFEATRYFCKSLLKLMADDSRELILKTIQEKALLKSEVSDHTSTGFEQLRKVLALTLTDLKASAGKINSKEIFLSLTHKSEFESEFNMVDDTIVFLMHTNVFTFESNHEIWKSSYVKQDPSLSYCGKIHVYNFLSDSFKYNRTNDVGYLIARIFINRENHFFLEGKRQLGFLYNDFANSVFDNDSIRKVLDSIILYSLDFEPFVPPYNQVSELSVADILNSTLESKIATGKRLGFRFQTDSGEIIS